MHLNAILFISYINSRCYNDKHYDKYKEKRDKRRMIVINFSNICPENILPNRHIDNENDYLHLHQLMTVLNEP
jgi:hypothetical protein